MTETTRAILLGIFTLASSIWVGGYVAIVVVARVASRVLVAEQRVALFRSLGRAHLRIDAPALVVALGTGAWLLSDHGWDGVLIAAVVVAAVLVISLAVGVGQARRITRLRAVALVSPSAESTDHIRRTARTAALLRAAIGVLTLTLIALGSVLAA